MQEEK